MFDITAKDIAGLDDETLRALIGRLCEAELRHKSIARSFVTWGGHQDANDGGIDVRVSLPTGTEINGFVPRPNSGFQSKASDFPRHKILEEMRPKGVLRPSIRGLADRSGAYIIVSSTESTTDTALEERRAAMKQAVADLPNNTDLTVAFYDGSQLATWTRDHQGVVLWLRDKIGKSIPGWRPYGGWARDPQGDQGEYLMDDRLRALSSLDAGSDFPVGECIARLRDLLSKPNVVVRLVGQSGVGKTRLAQALFDDRLGHNSLDPSIACYSDVGDEGVLSPTTVATNLIADRRRAILVIDNCRPELHARLSEQCKAPNSQLSLLTIEYDIREDVPEETQVFILNPSSLELMERLVRYRFPHLSPIDAHKMLNFLEGTQESL